METQPLDFIPVWMMYPLLILVSLAIAEAGYRFGGYWKKRTRDTKDPVIGAMVAASLGFLALLLAFVIGIAATRFDTRRMLLIEEANAIRTTELRARYITEPEKNQALPLLRDYVNVRVAGLTGMPFEQMKTRSNELQAKLWTNAENIARANTNSEMMALYVDSVNSLIAIGDEREAAIMARVPFALTLAIFVIAELTMFLIGFANSYDGRRSGIAMVVLVLIFGLAMAIIVDLDHPYEGLITINPQPLYDLQKQSGMPR